MISVNRRRVAELEGRYPSVRFECVDVRSAKDVEALVRGLTASGELPDVFILNAGINRLDNDEAFDLPLYREVIDTNLFGVLNFIAPLTQRAGRRRRATRRGHQLHGHLRRQPVWPRVSDEQAGSDDLLRRVVQHVHGDGPGLQTGHPGTRCTPSIYTMDEKLPGWMVRIKSLSSASLNGTVRAISRFARTRKKKLVHPWRAVAVFGAVRLARWLVPGFIQGRRTLEGKPRRKAG